MATMTLDSTLIAKRDREGRRIIAIDCNGEFHPMAVPSSLLVRNIYRCDGRVLVALPTGEKKQIRFADIRRNFRVAPEPTLRGAFRGWRPRLDAYVAKLPATRLFTVGQAAAFLAGDIETDKIRIHLERMVRRGELLAVNGVFTKEMAPLAVPVKPLRFVLSNPYRQLEEGQFAIRSELARLYRVDRKLTLKEVTDGIVIDCIARRRAGAPVDFTEATAARMGAPLFADHRVDGYTPAWADKWLCAGPFNKMARAFAAAA